MAKLLTPGDFAAIRETLEDVQETFYELDITYRKAAGVGANRMMRDTTESRSFTDIVLKGLVVWNDASNSKNKQEVLGTPDFSDGYCLVRYSEALSKGLVDGNKNIAGITAEDRLKFNNVEYYLEKSILVGQLEDTPTLLKIFFRKDAKLG